MISIENDEFTPLTIELCQKISVLKRDNTVFEINFLLDISSKTPSMSKVSSKGANVSQSNHCSAATTPISYEEVMETEKISPLRGQNHKKSKHFWNKNRQNSNSDLSKEPMFSQQSSTGSLSLPNKESAAANKTTSQFQPYQADNIEIWTDTSRSHSPSRSSTMELIDVGDYKPTNYSKHWNPTQIIPTLEQISAAQKHCRND